MVVKIQTQVIKMKSTNQKTLLSLALGVALGVTNVTLAVADPITSLKLGDVDGDGLVSDFRFGSQSFPQFPTGDSSNSFGRAGETGCVASSNPDVCDPIDFTALAELPPLTFSTGFNFGGAGDFRPSIQNASASGLARGEITVDKDGNKKLDFTALDFAGFYNGATFFLSPECRQEQKSNCNQAIFFDHVISPDSEIPIANVKLTDNNNGTYGVVFNFSSDNPVMAREMLCHPQPLLMARYPAGALKER